MKYRLTEPQYYIVAENIYVPIQLEAPAFTHEFFQFEEGRMLVKEDYAWDGPSGPAIDTLNSMLASAVHDALYQAIELGLLSSRYRKQCDRVYYDLCRKNGMSRFRAWYQYSTIRKFYKPWKKLFRKDYTKVYEA